MRVVALTGKGGGAIGRCSPTDGHPLCVPSDRTARIQEVHLLTLHCLCDGIDCSVARRRCMKKLLLATALRPRPAGPAGLRPRRSPPGSAPAP
jgi:hypothetical protein